MIVMSTIIEESSKKRSKITVSSYSLKNEESLETLALSRRQELIVNGPVDYVHIESSGTFIDVLSGDSVRFSSDSKKAVEATSDSKIIIPKYYWSQTEDSLTVLIKISEKDQTAEVTVNVTETSISVNVGDVVIVQGGCPFLIEKDSANWNKEKDTLKVEMKKQESGQMWDELIKGDATGEHLPNEELSSEIHSRLSNLCTDKPDNDNGQPAIGFNAEQLEECDLEGDENYLQRIDLEGHATTHLAMLGASNRVLFTKNLKIEHHVCIRQDHDGCVWSLSEDPDWSISHISTFPGFGYVEASKSNKKFCMSPPNGGYVVIIEHIRHAFVYEQPGTKAKVAKQKIADLGVESMAIMGAAAMDDYLILLTANKLYKLKID